MKNKKFKNYIAFTLTEMTLVLLITSILAAVLTPAITKNISNNAKKMSADVVVSPWKDITTDYPYRGMFNLGAFNYSTVSMGFKPTQSADTYRAPALILRSKYDSSKTNIYTSPQIALFRSNTFSAYPLKFGLDNNDNIHLGVLNFYNVSNTVAQYGNSKSVFIGNYINYNNSATGYANGSVYIGNNLYQKYGSLNSIYIGSYITSTKYDSNNVIVGSRIYSTLPGTYTVVPAYRDSVLIGRYAGLYSISQFDVKIGTYAGSGEDPALNEACRNIAIGQYANYVPFANNLEDNVSIGYFAGYSLAESVGTFDDVKNVNIGQYAGAAQQQNENNVNVGSYAGYIEPSTDYDADNYIWKTYNINIGENAGSFNTNSYHYNISIGRYAGYANSDIGDYNIAIGQYAGSCAKNAYNSIFIGANNNKGVVYNNYNSQNAIIIGYSTRASNWYNGVYGSIRLGASTVNVDHWYNNIAIGYNACGVSGLRNKVCIGAYSGISTTGFTADVWGANTYPQTFIGNQKFTYANNYITLYAAHVFGPSANFTNMSDRRLKENIVPSKHSLDDIRKVNIYNYNMKGDKNKTPHIGVIAQEHKKIFPHAVSKYPKSKYYTVSAEWMNFTAVNAVKEIDKTVQQIQASVKTFIKDFMGLKSRVEKLEAKLAQLQKENKEIKTHLNKVNAKLK